MKVKLSDTGLCLYRNYFKAEPEIDHEGYTAMQIWHFVEIYGNYIGKSFEGRPLESFIALINVPGDKDDGNIPNLTE